MNRKSVHVDIGVNSAFMTRRYEEPESWIGIVRDLGFSYMSFDSDALDPFFSGSRDYVLEKAAQVGQTAKRMGVIITDYFTGFASYRFMGFAHRDVRQRERMKEWFEGAIDVAAAMGASGAGGRCDALSAEVLRNPEETRERMAQTVTIFKELSRYAQKAGLSSIYNEIMYVPSLVPHTFKESEEFFCQANNSVKKGVPIRPVVDTGHACGQNYGLSGDELRYEAWIERWGGACDILHIQQTRRAHSDHAPFCHGSRGDVTVEAILKSLKTSLDSANEAPWSDYLSVPGRIILSLEAIPSTADNEETVYRELKESVDYLRGAIPEGGIEL